MDPLSALSLAGTVIQFVDFGSKLISQGYELYKSTKEDVQLAVDEELELVTSDLRDVILRIQGANVITPLHPSTSTMIDSSSSHSTSFARICVEAVEVAQVILTKLDSFKFDSNIKSSKRLLVTFHHILKRLWSKNELTQLQERLKTLKDEIDRVVLVAIL
jgi:short-subunit dehydrogenase